MILSRALAPLPSFYGGNQWMAGPGGFAGPMSIPGAPMTLEGGARDLYAKSKPTGPNKAAGLASVGTDFVRSIEESRRQARENHEAGIRRISELQSSAPSPASYARPQQMPLMSFGGTGMFGSRRY